LVKKKKKERKEKEKEKKKKTCNFVFFHGSVKDRVSRARTNVKK